MTVGNRCGATLARYLNDRSPALQLVCQIISHLLAYRHIVGSYIGSIVGRLYHAVVKNDGNTGTVSTLYRWRNSLDITGSHHQEVDLGFHQAVYLPDLALPIVVGRGEDHIHILILILAYLDFAVHLLAPQVVTALGHTYHGAPVGTGHEDEQQKDYI